MPRLCTISECDKPHKAKGLCSTHYNQQDPGRHKKIAATCDYCGKTTEKESRAQRYVGRYCAERCRDEARKLKTKQRQSQVQVFRPTPLWHTAHMAYNKPKQTARVFVSTRCTVCGDMFLDLFGSKACGGECQRRHNRDMRNEAKQRRRARKAAAFVSPVHRREIFARDNYTCQLCLHPMEMDKTAPHPRSPSIDHVIALANGGTHEPANVQAACFMCNAIKGDREWAAAAA